MQRLRLAFGFFIFSLFLTSASAQSTSNIIASNLFTSDLTEYSDDTWSFYVDDEHQVYFIDFEKLNVNLSTILVKNDKGEELMRDDVVDLPVNTIYEIDFSKYGAGNYQVELRSYTEFIRKTVTIK